MTEIERGRAEWAVSRRRGVGVEVERIEIIVLKFGWTAVALILL